MTVCWLQAATYEEVAALDRRRAVAVVPLGATEAHGPHLPLSTDVIIVEAMARAGAERLSQQGATVLVLPTVALTPAPFAAAFAGTGTGCAASHCDTAPMSSGASAFATSAMQSGASARRLPVRQPPSCAFK